MYGLKRLEFDEYRQVTAVEFYPDISSEAIIKILNELGFPYGAHKVEIPLEKPTTMERAGIMIDNKPLDDLDKKCEALAEQSGL